MYVTEVLTKNYEDQQKPAKKQTQSNPIFWTKALFLSEKSMIPNYIKYAKQSQLEN